MMRLQNISGIFFLLSLCACSVTKQLPQNDALYAGSKVEIKRSSDSVKLNKKLLTEELEDLIRPKPNASFLGIKFKLMIFNMIDTPKKDHGLMHWLKYKVGEPPVLASSVNLEKNRLIMQNRIENRGYFKTEVTVDTVIKNKKMNVTYAANLLQRYIIRNVYYPTDSGQIYTIIRRITKASPLKPGRPYNLSAIMYERDRIDARLKENGFYYFNPDDIIVDVDSSLGQHKIDMYVRIKKQTPFNHLVNYRINDVVVYADYHINADTAARALDKTKKFQGYTIIDPEQKFNPKIFPQTLVFKPKSIYKRSDHSRALNRLVSLGVYKFVKVRFEEVDTSNRPLLNAFYYLTPMPKKSLSLEVSGLTKSNNATGTNVSLNWKNRNAFKGAELFTATVFGGFEKQVSAQQRVNTIRGGVDLNLVIPRVIGPVPIKNNSAFVPQTVVNLGYELFSRDTQYTLSSAKASLGYRWKRSVSTEHEWKFLSVNYVRPTNIKPDFQLGLDTNITLARSIEKQFIIGMTYNYNYNSQAVPNKKKNNYYFNGNADVSGNVLGIITGANAESGNQKNILGTPFSQYIRGEADFRHYMRIGKNNVLASRFFAGAGYAWGNSLTMPFVKEFFAGGVNSIRAFRARGLGPGSYYAGNPKDVYVADQPGDIRLEMNTELRAKLVSFLYGAVFVDAGNVWLFKEDPSRPGGKFTGNFLSQVAVGTGIGLRVDVSFFVLRADLAFPIRKPYITTGSKWVFDQINFGDNEWRRNNLILNIAIGYPF
ncbi:BamA/TamA family outer membrane protein [Panacibacter ginsenosidivorans]|uniref:BamA/TamA family outer membrane protein n=1 Tax=Panacibacter ginsenosidivorans TaxID=1813871 RepID=A0A5B8VBA7_9BACT|nr:BamA/TamA family outer membrane protein [Panacibacter ginsenosidivorans]QEC68770.1 BamA/TamA family outer membrane protein [Panacibacter ginsenosidivorans]